MISFRSGNQHRRDPTKGIPSRPAFSNSRILIPVNVWSSVRVLPVGLWSTASGFAQSAAQRSIRNQTLPGSRVNSVNQYRCNMHSSTRRETRRSLCHQQMFAGN